MIIYFNLDHVAMYSDTLSRGTKEPDETGSKNDKNILHQHQHF